VKAVKKFREVMKEIERDVKEGKATPERATQFQIVFLLCEILEELREETE